jgi:RNA polymerase sigma-70 factor (ECF subfamily)
VEITFEPWMLAGEPKAAARDRALCGQRTSASMDSPVASGSALEPEVADDVLMQRYQRGDETAFRLLYEFHRAPLLRFVRRLIPDAAEAEEVAQETWMAVIQGRERYSPKARFVTYLFSIARRRTMDRWRKRGRSPEMEPESEDLDQIEGPCTREPEWQAGNAALGVALLAALSAIPLLQREAFLLRAEGGLSLEEIAQVTGTSRETAKTRLRYATQKLRLAMESWT